MILSQQTAELFHAKDAASLRELLEGGRLPALFTGLSAAARAHLASVLTAETGCPVVVVCADESAAETFARDASALLSQPVPVLAARDFTFYTAVGVSRQTEQRRIGALYALAEGKTPLIVATVSGMLQRAIPRHLLMNTAFTIEDGSTVPPEDVEYALLRCGYLRTQQVEGPGQFSRRGGILDLFSPADDLPVRIEFWGDDVDSMSYFEIDSQRRTEALKVCRILPAAETLPTLYPGGMTALGGQLLDMSKKAARRKASVQAENLVKALRQDGEILSDGNPLPAADRYMGVVYEQFEDAE